MKIKVRMHFLVLAVLCLLVVSGNIFAQYGRRNDSRRIANALERENQLQQERLDEERKQNHIDFFYRTLREKIPNYDVILSHPKIVKIIEAQNMKTLFEPFHYEKDRVKKRWVYREGRKKKIENESYPVQVCVLHSPEKAVDALRKLRQLYQSIEAAYSGDAKAAFEVGKMYEENLFGERESLSYAYAWYLVAKQKGYSAANKNLQAIKLKVSPRRISLGKKIYAELVDEIGN